ncbi:MAG TPA: HNH endonuclease [Rhizomicrobium sp.]|jgi:putative restriction endonuclease|nr:HNH endonuclease [Rhizomicrobium sp.]
MVKLWIANTDNDWFDFLAAQPGLDEVNFWQPSGRTDFHAIQPGELFLFRLKSPRNRIGGFGVFEHASRLPLSLAWDAFGIKNGASSFEEMRQRISRYVQADVRADHVLGCRIVTQPVFLSELAWIPLPLSWSANVQVGKVYGTDTEEGRRIWDRVMEAGLRQPTAPVYEPAAEPERARFGEPVLITPRLGQGAFRIAVTDAYQRQCAISRGRVLPALEAAHIRPYSDGGKHDVCNGLLLRTDIHRVFDAGYATIDADGPDWRFIVSNRVKSDFNNGNEYLRLHGSKLVLPPNPRFAPSREAVRWHNNNRFLKELLA